VIHGQPGHILAEVHPYLRCPLRGQHERIPPAFVIGRLAIQLDHLKRVDVNVERVAKDILVDQRPFLSGVNQHRLIYPAAAERLAIEEKLHGHGRDIA
jgi:hypothetical protein